MSLTTIGAPAAPAAAPAVLDRPAADHAGRGRKPRWSWLPNLLEALAYAGASIDPSAALAAQRFARIRDQERDQGR